MKRLFASIACFITTILGVPCKATAHEPTITRAAATFDDDGSYRIDLTCDLDAMLLSMEPGRLSDDDYDSLRALSVAELTGRIETLQTTFVAAAGPLFDGRAPDHGPLKVEFPEFSGDVGAAAASSPIMGRRVVMTGQVPDGARAFALRSTPAFDWINLAITREDCDDEFISAFKGGQPSGDYPLAVPAAATGFWSIAAQYLSLGFEHIVPKGLDHILFVLGLYLLSPKLRPLLWQLTAFTIAHSATLALSMTGVFSLPSWIVEPAIAGSIAYVAIENIARSELKVSRTAVVFLFGLIHGLGFAGVLSDLGLPRGAFLPALISFNVGVEFGQIFVVLGAILAIGWFRSRAWYRAGAVIPASCAIAAIGLYWAVERAVAG
jgi:hypothetical protein